MLIRYAAMRLVQLVPMVLVVTMVVFFVMMIVPGDPVMVMLGAVDGARFPARSMTRCACGSDWTNPSSSNISTGFGTCFRATWAARLPTGHQPWK